MFVLSLLLPLVVSATADAKPAKIESMQGMAVVRSQSKPPPMPTVEWIAKVNDTKVLEEFIAGCQAGDKQSCFRHAVAVSLHGNDTSWMPGAADILQAACNENYMEACEFLSQLHESGVLPKDMTVIAELHARTCDVGKVIHGCAVAAGQYLQLGRIENAADYWKRSCDIEPSYDCQSYASLLFEKFRDTPRFAEALAYSRRHAEWAASKRQGAAKPLPAHR